MALHLKMNERGRRDARIPSWTRFLMPPSSHPYAANIQSTDRLTTPHPFVLNRLLFYTHIYKYIYLVSCSLHISSGEGANWLLCGTEAPLLLLLCSTTWSLGRGVNGTCLSVRVSVVSGDRRFLRCIGRYTTWVKTR